jgi:superfamily II DNA/RNA helicase
MDEADRMVDLGFEIDLNLILDSMPATGLGVEDISATADVSQLRVTSLYSATMPIQVERIARKYLRKPATITIGDAGEAAQTVQQIVEFIASDEKKKARLIDILRNGGFAAPIVSLSTCRIAVLIQSRLSLSIRNVRLTSLCEWYKVRVGRQLRFTLIKPRLSERLLYSRFGMERYRH